jgi:hypothetical protein
VAAPIRNLATLIGVITGAGTIVGWIVSTESPAVVAGTAVGYAGMAYCAGFALVGFACALLPTAALERVGGKGGGKARAYYFGAGCVFSAFFAGVGTDPLDGVWITLGAASLLIVGYVSVLAYRDAAVKRKGEYRECPDCAEMVKSRARVCHYCGYRFAPPPDETAVTAGIEAAVRSD